MQTRFVSICCFATVSVNLVALGGCKSSTGSIQLAAGAISSLPSIEAASGQQFSYLTQEGASTTTASSDSLLQRFFKLECWRGADSGREFHLCPEGIAETNANKFTGSTLIGTIAAVDDYGPDVLADSGRRSCGAIGGHSATVSAASFVSRADGGNGSKLVIDTYAKYNCIAKRDFDGSYYAYSKTEDEQKYYMVRTRKNVQGGGYVNTDFMQMYLETTEPDALDQSGQYAFLAFNSVGLTSRIVLLMNMQTHRFMVKMLQRAGNTDSEWLVAAGIGGIDPATRQLRQGTYTAIVNHGQAGTHAYCVNNADSSDATPSACADSNATTGALSNGPAEYLGMTSTQAADLAGFVAYFANAVPLSASNDLPDAVDPEKDFPDLIQ